MLLAVVLHVLALYLFAQSRSDVTRFPIQETAIKIRLIQQPRPEMAKAEEPVRIRARESSKDARSRDHAMPTPVAAFSEADLPDASPGRSDRSPLVSADDKNTERKNSSSALATTALEAAGKVDRDLRQQLPRHLHKGSQVSAPQLGKAIEAAALKAANTTEEVTFPDGRRMTKVYGPTGTYCIFTRSVGTTAGLDVIQDGMQQFSGTCPH